MAEPRYEVNYTRNAIPTVCAASRTRQWEISFRTHLRLARRNGSKIVCKVHAHPLLKVPQVIQQLQHPVEPLPRSLSTLAGYEGMAFSNCARGRSSPCRL